MIGIVVYMIALAIILSSLGGILLSLARTNPLLALTGLLWQAFSVAASIGSVAWLKRCYDLSRGLSLRYRRESSTLIKNGRL